MKYPVKAIKISITSSKNIIQSDTKYHITQKYPLRYIKISITSYKVIKNITLPKNIDYVIQKYQ